MLHGTIININNVSYGPDLLCCLFIYRQTNKVYDNAM